MWEPGRHRVAEQAAELIVLGDLSHKVADDERVTRETRTCAIKGRAEACARELGRGSRRVTVNK